MARRHLQGPDHELPQGLRVVDDLHGPATQDIGGPDENRIADLLGRHDGLLGVHRRVVARLVEIQAVHDLLEPLPVFRPVDGVGEVQDRCPGGLQTLGQVRGVCPPD